MSANIPEDEVDIALTLLGVDSDATDGLCVVRTTAKAPYTIEVRAVMLPSEHPWLVRTLGGQGGSLTRLLCDRAFSPLHRCRASTMHGAPRGV